MRRKNKKSKNQNDKSILTQKRDRRESAAMAVSTILVMCVMLLLVGAIIAVCFYFVYAQKQGDGDSIGHFIAMFSILITLVAILLPVGSYFVNRSEIQKITSEYNKLFRDEMEKVEKRISDVDKSYVEMFENAIKRRNVRYLSTDNLYVKVSKDYVNALVLFTDGIYSKSKRKLSEAIGKITSNVKEFLTADEDSVLVLYKILNLYRKLCCRASDCDLGFINKLNKLMDNEIVKDNQIAHMVVCFLYIKSRFDFIEKVSDDNLRHRLWHEFESLNDMINDTNFYEWMQYALLAKYHCIKAYYTGSNTENCMLHNRALEFGKLAIESSEFYSILKQESELNDVEREIFKSCASMVAKVFSFSYFVCDCMQKQSYLFNAKEIYELLIKQQREAKYYLELSNVYKKLGRNCAENFSDEEYRRFMYDSAQCAQYGYSIAPDDPLLAAQCAHLYMAEYLRDRSSSKEYLIKARECIQTAKAICMAESAENFVQSNEKTQCRNSKFSYVDSLFATIETYFIISTNRKLTKCDGLERIHSSITSSIKGDPNNYANYRRALLVYCELYIYALKNNKCDWTLIESPFSELCNKIIDLTKKEDISTERCNDCKPNTEKEEFGSFIKEVFSGPNLFTEQNKLFNRIKTYFYDDKNNAKANFELFV